MTPCARQVMNRIPGNVTPPWAASLMRNEWHNIRTSTEKPTTIKADPQTEAPTAPRQGDPVSRVTFARNMESSPHWRFLWFQFRDMDAVTPKFTLDLHNTSPQYFHHLCALSNSDIFNDVSGPWWSLQWHTYCYYFVYTAGAQSVSDS